MKSWIEKTYKGDIDLLPIQIKYYHSINFKKDELLIHERKFKILPKLKFIRGKETQIILSDRVIKRCNINIPYTIEKEIIMKDCTKFHNDYIEYEIEKKHYNQPELSNFIQQKLEKYNEQL